MEGVTVLLASAVSTVRSYKPSYHMYRCLVSVTAEARMTAGTRDATLMAIDAGLWMKLSKTAECLFHIVALWNNETGTERQLFTGAYCSSYSDWL